METKHNFTSISITSKGFMALTDTTSQNAKSKEKQYTLTDEKGK